MVSLTLSAGLSYSQVLLHTTCSIVKSWEWPGDEAKGVHNGEIPLHSSFNGKSSIIVCGKFLLQTVYTSLIKQIIILMCVLQDFYRQAISRTTFWKTSTVCPSDATKGGHDLQTHHAVLSECHRPTHSGIYTNSNVWHNP